MTWRDPRTPESCTRHGRVTVRVYDEQAYAENIRHYYAGDVPSQSNTRKYAPFAKQKPTARYNWTPKGRYMPKEGQSA